MHTTELLLLEDDEFKYVPFPHINLISSNGQVYIPMTIWIASVDLADYHGIYLKCHMLPSADFFEKFSATCSEHYGLDAVQYFTVPGLAWDAALRMSRVSP